MCIRDRGHSGAGKSTFLKLILREEAATEGTVFVNGRDLSSIRQREIPYLRRGPVSYTHLVVLAGAAITVGVVRNKGDAVDARCV